MMLSFVGNVTRYHRIRIVGRLSESRQELLQVCGAGARGCALGVPVCLYLETLKGKPKLRTSGPKTGKSGKLQPLSAGGVDALHLKRRGAAGDNQPPFYLGGQGEVQQSVNQVALWDS